MHQATVEPTANGFRVYGQVMFSNVRFLRAQGEKLIRDIQNHIEIDLSEMKDQDASTFSLLLCWVRFAQKNTNTVHFKHAPQSLQRMRKMFGLTEVISF
jgi:ABC-type transporter Mla MlaB component